MNILLFRSPEILGIRWFLSIFITANAIQEILMNISDMAIETYVAESLLLRIEKLSKTKDIASMPEQIAMMNVYLYDAADKINKIGKVCNT